jgi:universal stress protein E
MMIRPKRPEKVLLILSPDLVSPDRPLDSALLRRAVQLARNTGCELELFHVCHDETVDRAFYAPQEDLQRERTRITNTAATRVAEIAARLRAERISVRHEARWDSPRVDALLRKIAEAQPDLVMKASREHGFMLGLTTNTDWELVRRATANVWLVNDRIDSVDRIVAALGNKSGEAADVITEGDYDILHAAGFVADAFGADVYTVNACQVAETGPVTATMGGMGAALPPQDQSPALRSKALKRHKASVRALVNYFNLPRRNVRIHEGHPNEVIPDVAESVNADLIVMGGRNISRLQRLLQRVTVEPIISETRCDVMIARDVDASEIDVVDEEPLRGIPNVDVERTARNTGSDSRS